MSSDLWSFALATYARPGVEDACLQLQTAGVNVCLLLCGLWLEQRGASCDEQRAGQLQALTGPWDIEVVQPLRTLRMQWKARALDDVVLKGIREQVKALELEAERALLSRLEGIAQVWGRNAAGSIGWLEALAGSAANLNRDALQVLRVAAIST
ncbi:MULTISPECIES: TIGR02444 family protein [unclassified Pseudomonas]|uniref:TIGR02444 family protein n=1 Tax=unclassified Pseudomonas TaxID=196821 RepID=UPI001B327CCD|nr:MULTISPECIES: TIGR02444 family protein [unclassified Pseudomonas]MBP5944053.1 TIGR02444 family protein [Pseudomonas sp. P9(2020)]MBZ9562918.1 TIGR02444 family protein [Pseudomonas sp. P116]